MAQKTNIPKKFRDKKFSSIRKIIEQAKEDKNIDFFPEGIRFDRKEQDEEVIMVVRKHWIAYIAHILVAFVLPLIPILLLVLSNNTDAYGKSTIYIGLFIASLVISINVIVTALIQWYYNVSIITDKRILALKVVTIFHHTYTEILWRKIQDVGHDTVGPFSYLFDVGNLYIDTAGEGIDLTLNFIPKPRDVQDVINNLVDLAHNGEL
jgi:hypothetical protein